MKFFCFSVRYITILLLMVLECTSSQFINWRVSQGLHDFPGFRWAENCDFRGGDIGNRATINIEQCARICQFESPGCTHASWTDFQNGTCWMKSGAVSEHTAITVSNSKCGFLTILWQYSETNGVFWSFNCDFPGGDFRKLLGKGEQCGQFCLSNPPCSHFTWKSVEGGTCFMKTGGASNNLAHPTPGSIFRPVCGFLARHSDSRNNIQKPELDYECQCECDN